MARRTRPDSKYPRPAVTVDVVAFTLRPGLHVLLVQRRFPPFAGMWALPGGFVEIEEPLEEAARRELWEESGLQPNYLEQLYTFGDPQRDPRTRVITVAYLALVPAGQEARAASDAAAARWFPAYAPPQLAFDHRRILDCAIARLRNQVAHSTLIFDLLPPEFTLGELQQAYEEIRNERLDKRNFRRKVLRAGLLMDTGRRKTGERRPARLYRPCDEAKVRARRMFP